MEILSWFLSRRARKTTIAAGRSIKVRIEEMEAGGETIEVEFVDAETEDEAWDAMDQGFLVTIPPELVPVLEIDGEATHEEFVDGILSDRMWAEEEATRIPASGVVQSEEDRARTGRGSGLIAGRTHLG